MPSSKSKPQLPTARSQSKCQSFCGKVLSPLNFKVSASRGGCGSRFHFIDNFWTLWEELHPSFDVSLRNSPTETYPFWTFFLSMKENWWVTHTHTHTQNDQDLLVSDSIAHFHSGLVRACHMPRPPLHNGLVRAPWRVGDTMASRGNDGWATSKSGDLCPCQNCSQGPPAEETGRGSLLNRSACPSDDPVYQETELMMRYFKLWLGHKALLQWC